MEVGYRIEIERPTDAAIVRDRGSRRASALVSSLVIAAVPIILLGLLGSIWDSTTTGCIVGFTISGIILSIVVPKRMLVINEEYAGYVTQDIRDKGKMILYGPGVSASHWWEQRNAEGNYSLKVDTKPFSIGVMTKSGKVIFDGEYERAIDLPFMDRAIGVTQSVVDKGITAFIENFLTVQCADRNTTQVRSQEALEKLGRDLSAVLMDESGTLAAIRNKYAYKTVAIIISNVTLPEEVTKTRSGIDEAEALFEVIAKLHGRTPDELKALIANGTVTEAQYQKMLTRAMAVTDNKTSINVSVIEGLEGNSGGAAKAAALFNSLNGGKK